MSRNHVLKWMDASAGDLLCRALSRTPSAVNLSPPSPPPAPAEVHRILVIRPGGIGDMIVLLPVLKRLQAHYPNAHLDIACQARHLDVLRLAGIPLPAAPFDTHPLQFLSSLRRNTYDMALDTEQFHNFSAVFAFMSKAPIRIGFKINPRRNPLYTHLVNYAVDGSEHEQFDRLLTPLGIPGTPVSPSGSLADFNADLPTAALSIVGGRRFTVLHAGTSSPYKVWPTERFGDVATRLSTAHKHAIVVVGDREDRPEATRIVEITRKAGRDAFSLAGSLDLAGTAAVIKHAALFVGTDSGLAHLARALDIPSVALFGPSDHLKWGHSSPRHAAVQKSLPCAPCFIFGYHKPCRSIACMKQISVQDVMDAAESVLGKS